MSSQSYYSGGKIRAIDFNGFVNDVNEIVGDGVGTSGYGQNSLVVSPITAGTKVRASQWDALLSSIYAAAQHQGTTITIPTSTADSSFPALNRIVTVLPDLENDITSIRANKLNYDLANMDVNSNTISTSKAYVIPTSSGYHWTDAVSYEFKASFATANNERSFFNTGGEIRIESSLTNYDAANAQSVDWNSILSSIGTVKLSVNLTSSSTSVGTPGVGFVDLTTSYQIVYTKGGTGDYSGNTYNVYAKTSGTSIDVKVELLDAHAADTGTWTNDGGGSWTGTDYVDGTLTISIAERVANGPYIVATSPTYSHISQL